MVFTPTFPYELEKHTELKSPEGKKLQKGVEKGRHTSLDHRAEISDRRPKMITIEFCQYEYVV